MARAQGWGKFWTIMRLIAALGIGAAIVAQAIQSFTGAVENGRHVATIVSNFFSFFTILSNLFSVLVLLWAVLWFWTRGHRKAAEPRGLALSLAAVTTYMIVTGIVYNLLLRGIALEPGSIIGWSNEILHLIGPVFLLLDLFLGPKRRRLAWGSIAGILIFPIAWVLYTLVRASYITNPATGDPWWYPYPFLNPHLNTYPALLAYIGGISVAIAAVAAIVVWVGRLRGRRADAATGAVETVTVLVPSVAVAAAVTDPVLPAPLPLPAAKPVLVEPVVVEPVVEEAIVEELVIEEAPIEEVIVEEPEVEEPEVEEPVVEEAVVEELVVEDLVIEQAEPTPFDDEPEILIEFDEEFPEPPTTDRNQ